MEEKNPLLRTYDASEREIAAEFLTDWLPFLSQDLCDHCSAAIRRRIQSLRTEPSNTMNSIAPTKRDPVPEPVTESSRSHTSWADMAEEEEDELEEIEDEVRLRKEEEEEGEEERGGESRGQNCKMVLSREQKEQNRFRNVKRNKEFICLERVRGRIVNIVAGLELHTGVFSPIEQKRIVDFVYDLQEKGRKGELGERTYSAPAKWMRGKGRVTMQFGCNYNYATDRNGNPPGIMQNVAADPMPDLFKIVIKRLLKWHVLPTTCVPDSCIVNIYEPGDCIPPHIDSHDFVRPFSTISFLSECNILFGSTLKVLGPGKFAGPTSISLPVGSVLVLNGNGADVAKHCVPAVPTKRISITFRKMQRSKWPVGFAPEPDLQTVVPLSYDEKSNVSEDASCSESRNLNSNSNSNSSFNSRRGRRPRGKAPMRAQLERSNLIGNGDGRTSQVLQMKG